MKSGHRILTCEERIEISSARKQESVDALKQGHRVAVSQAARRDDNGNTSRSLHRTKIAGQEFQLSVIEISGDADDWPRLEIGKCGGEAVIVGRF